MRLVVAAAIGAAMLVVPVASAGAGAQATLELAPTSGPPGTVVTATAMFCDLGTESMRLELLDPNGVVVVDTGFFMPTGTPDGIQGTISVPDASEAGVYTVRLTCDNLPPDLQTAVQPFEVLGVAPPAPPPEPVDVGPTFTG